MTDMWINVVMGRYAEFIISMTICHIYPTIMKLGTVIPYLKKI